MSGNAPRSRDRRVETGEIIRKIAGMNPLIGWDVCYCAFCGARWKHEPHAADCIWARARWLCGLPVPAIA